MNTNNLIQVLEETAAQLLTEAAKLKALRHREDQTELPLVDTDPGTGKSRVRLTTEKEVYDWLLANNQSSSTWLNNQQDFYICGMGETNAIIDGDLWESCNVQYVAGDPDYRGKLFIPT